MVHLDIDNIRLLFLRKQGAWYGPQTSCDGIPSVQQWDNPPGLELQSFPPQVPQLAGQHAFPYFTPPYVAHVGSKYMLMNLDIYILHMYL